MSFEAYRVSVRLSLVNHVSAGLVALSGQFTGLNHKLGTTKLELSAIEARLKSIKMLGLTGGVVAGVGFAGLSMLKGPIEEAKLFQTETAKFAALGLGTVVNDQAVTFAKGMDIMGQSARDNLKLVREATSIMGDFEHAKEAVPLLAKMKFGIESVMGGEHAGRFEQMFQAAIKTTELRGALVNRDTGHIDIAKFHHTLDLMTQAYVASGGTVKPQDYLAAIKTGGVSAKLMNDEMFFFGLGHFMQESGGSRTGTAAMSMFQNLAMGRVSRVVAENLADTGAIPRSAIKHSMGPLASIEPMSLKSADLFIANPFKWVNETLVPMLKAKGFEGERLNIKLAQMFGIRTAANLADQFVREQKIADLYIERSRKAAGIDTLYKEGGDSLQGKELEMHAKWRDVLRELGTVVLPAAIAAVEKLTSSIKDFIGFAKEYPVLFKTLTWGFVGLSAAMAIGGTLMVLTAGFKALNLVMTMGQGVGGLLGGVAAGLGLVGKASLALSALWAAYKIAELGKAAVNLYQVKQREGVKLTPEAYARVAAGETGVKVIGSETQRQYWASIGMDVPGINAPWPTARPGEVAPLMMAKPAVTVLPAPAGVAVLPNVVRDSVTKSVVYRQAEGVKAPASPYIAPKSTQTVQVSTQVNLDGRKVGEVVSTHQAREAHRAMSGITGFDGSQQLAPVGMR